MGQPMVFLIVVPDNDDRSLLARVAAGGGREVVLATTVAGARRLLGRRQPAAVVAADRLADGSGLEFLLQVRGEREECYTALVVDRPEVDTLLAVIEAEIDDCFVAPLAEQQVGRRFARALERIGLRRELAESRAELLRNFQTAQVVNTVLHVGLEEWPLQEKLQEVLDHLLSLPWLAFQRKGAIFLAEGPDGGLRLVVASGIAGKLMDSCRRLRPGQCLCGTAAQTGEVVFADCVDARHTVRYEGMMPHGHYIVPIRSQDRLLGVINIYTAEGHPRSTAAEQFLLSVADALAVMILRHREAEEREELQRVVRQGQKLEAIGTLAGGIAHDFNNILTSILGYANLVREQCPPDSRMAEDVEQIITAGHRARDLVRQILAFSRQREGQPQPVQVRLLLKEALKLLRASLPATIEIRQELRDDGTVRADPAGIHQVIMNLCTNAYLAMGDKGVLEVGLERVRLGPQVPPGLVGNLAPGDWIRLAIADNGCGMTPEVQERIFEPYFTTREAEGGTGLGLATVYGIVRSLGGDVRVTSTAGEGSLFEVFFPPARVAGAAQEALPAVEEDALPRGAEHILCVDDEPAITEVCRRSLEFLGYRVTTCTDPREAFALVRAEPGAFDLLLTDYTMPGMTGVELADAVRVLRPGLPVLLVTGYSELIAPEFLADHRIDGLLAKPLLRRDLAWRVRRALDRGRQPGDKGR